jgi:hypothetical protein
MTEWLLLLMMLLIQSFVTSLSDEDYEIYSSLEAFLFILLRIFCY